MKDKTKVIKITYKYNVFDINIINIIKINNVLDYYACTYGWMIQEKELQQTPYYPTQWAKPLTLGIKTHLKLLFYLGTSMAYALFIMHNM